ncbi:acetoin utilization deacetylase AcuC-like enzyme [Chitinophaga dinghuensis]|uniref:Acetoin utilization deacetylase AcuC-like enzyme n=1 Tax=Chitinophaga dinghuensis TaxID=1539050 RepID=A0A327W1A9_9BACT|nr:histone deacetylase [Chitinophaga dinghuensis]RAJ83077.1 acetoin utilization deacetylase AcuC-like enzyme [Chitinophaga dinghuensis]
MKIAFHEVYIHPLPPNHRFPMIKYELIPEQLLREGIIREEHLFMPAPAEEAIILLTHTREYWEKLRDQGLTYREQRQIGFEQSPRLTLREIVIAQGTIDISLHALEHGLGFNVAGGTHHAFAGKGEGFCLLNDIAVAANYLLDQRKIRQALVIDLDVHQGNGTAAIFENNPHVYTFSMHGAHNYPFHKERSDLDIPLPDGITDGPYLRLLEESLEDLINKVRPDIVYYLSGVDILETDKLGKLKITAAGCRDRDAMVFSALRRHSIPVAVVMGGGYSPRVKHVVDAHCQTFREGIDQYGY